MTLKNDVSMISLVMQHLKVEQEEPADIGGFDFNGADFSDIFGDIFGDLFGGGRSRGREPGTDEGGKHPQECKNYF